jgi:hypothetical protein
MALRNKVLIAGVVLSISLPCMAGMWMAGPGKGYQGSTTPVGNPFTIVQYSATESSNSFLVGSAVTAGNTLVIRISWSGGGTLTGMTSSLSGACTLRGSQVDASNGDKSARWVTVVSAGGNENLTPTFSGSGTFRNWSVWEVSATGTIDFSITAIGNGTGTSVATGSFTTITQKGLVLAGADIYGTATASNARIGGNVATTSRFGTFTNCWDYTHTSQLSSATATLTTDTSFVWICNAIALSAQ